MSTVAESAFLKARADAGSRFFAADAERIARLCHRMSERFLAGGRLLAFGSTAPERSDVRHVAVEFVHPVIVGKRALPALGLTDPDELSLVAEPDDIVMAFGAGATARSPARAGMPDRRVRAAGRRMGARAAERRSVRPSGARRDHLPRAVGAGARVLRAQRSPDAGGGRGELPLSVPGRPASRSRARHCRRARVGADEGQRGPASPRANGSRPSRRARRGRPLAA